MSVFTLAILFDYFHLALIHGPNIPGSYAILLFTASDFTSITSHIHNLVLLLLWLYLFILSGVTSPLISSSILGTYWPGKFIFQCPIFLPFHTIHGFLKVRILKWFAIPFSSGQHFVRTFHHDPTSWLTLHVMSHSFIELDKVVIHLISLVHFLWLWFTCIYIHKHRDFPGGSVMQYLPANAGDTYLVPGLGRYSWGGNGNPLQYSYG